MKRDVLVRVDVDLCSVVAVANEEEEWQELTLVSGEVAGSYTYTSGLVRRPTLNTKLEDIRGVIPISSCTGHHWEEIIKIPKD